MAKNTIDMHYAHSDGQTNICFSSDGKYVLTCGSEGDVRIRAHVMDDEPISECVGDSSYALGTFGDHFYVGTDNNFVQAYTFPDVKRDGIVCRFTAPVTHIDINKDGTLLAASSCDMDIQVAALDKKCNITKFSGHTAPVTGVAFDPLGEYLASSSCDGTMKVWNLSTESLATTFPNLIPVCNDFFRAVVLGRPSWQGTSGDYLAVPSGQEVILYERGSWDISFKLTDSRIISPLSVTAFSPCGTYVVAISTTGELFIWNVKTQKIVGSHSHPRRAAICGIAWHPEDNVLGVSDRLGQYAILRNTLNEISDSEIPSNSPFNDYDNEDENDENAISIEEIKRTSGWGSQEKDDAEDVASVTDDNHSEIVSRPVKRNIQPPFQPSSTPVHLQHRFMVWNSIGIVRCFNTEEESSIDVEFHDSMFHHSMHINNCDGFSMAALSSRVLALASGASDECQSKLKCVLLNAWDGSKEWTISLSPSENIVALAAEGDWVAIATDNHHLRVFTFAGTQKQPVALPGPPVCLSGHENKICVIYHQGPGFDESQNLGVTVYESSKLFLRTVVSTQPLPLSPCSTLKWCGFSDEGRLCSFDSVGLLRSLSLDAKYWTLFSDTRLQNKGMSDHYFIIGVCERYQNIRCVLCKGSYYPMVTPRPTVVEIPLKIPLCEPETEKSELEDEFWRLMSCMPLLENLNKAIDGWQMDISAMEKRLKQFIVKLFANACRSDMDIRATDVAGMMPEQQLQMASKYASKCGKMKLADKLNDMQPVDWMKMWTLAASQFNYEEENYGNQSMEQIQKIEDGSQNELFPNPSKGQEKLILYEKENELSAPPTTPSSNSLYKNPFQMATVSNEGPKGLSFFNKPLPTRVPKVEPLKTAPLAKIKGPKNKSIPKNEPKKMSFVQWFSTRKTELMEHYPELNPSELTKKAMQMFREESNNVQPEESNNHSMDESKRKLEDDDADTPSQKVKKMAVSKLSAFAFNGKS